MSKKTATLPVNTLSILCYIVFTCLLLSQGSDGAVDNLEVPPNFGCVCPGDELTFICTIIGGGNTIWRGTAFDCSSSSNEIILRHSQFEDPGAVGSCTANTLRARSLDVENGNCFVSELNATIMASFDGQTIGCYHNSVSGTTLVNESVLNIVSDANPVPPQNLELMSINGEQDLVSFNWTALSPPCSFVEYTYIITSDCGVCPDSTDSSMVNCTGFQLPSDSNDTECTFTINSRLCDITGDISAEVLLRVPNVPSIENVIPSYLNDTKELRRLVISVTKNETEAIMNDVSGAITTYNLLLSTSVAGPTPSIPIVADSESCEENTCTYTVDVPQDICTSSSNLNTALSARNRIGQGFPSDIINIGCTNEFVKLYFNATTSIFTCVFTNEMDNSERFCSIRLTRDGQELPNVVQGTSTNANASDVSLNLGDIADGMYFFIVSASSGVTTVQVEGNFRIGSKASINPAIAAVVVVPVVIIGVTVAVIVGVCLKRAYSHRKDRQYRFKHVESQSGGQHTEKDPIRDIKLKQVELPESFKLFAVQSDCSQREAMSVIKLTGDIYYELTDEKEDIPNHELLIFILQKKFPKIEQTESPAVGFSATNASAVAVIPLTQVMEQVLPYVFASDVDSKALLARGLIGEGISRLAFRGAKYRVFVKSEASGTRHLARGTCILFEEHHVKDQESNYPLSPLPIDYFAVCHAGDVDTTLGEVYENISVDRNKLNTCLEFELSDQTNLDDDKVREVVFMDEDGQLFTGPGARKILQGEKLDEKYKDMRTFVLGIFDEKQKLKKGTTVLYENSDHRRSTFRMLEVDSHNVRMSEFVKEKTGGFKRGQVYYEFTEKEDLPYCRKVIQLVEGKFNNLKADKQVQELDASIEVFYSVPGAPGMNVSPPKSTYGTRTFIHDPTQGSRCLKKGMFLLYKCEGPKNGNSNNNTAIKVSSVDKQ